MVKNPKLKIIFLGIVFSAFPFFVSAVSLGGKVNFSVDPSYDLSARTQVTATLEDSGSQIYFYIDDAWWNSLDFNKQREVNSTLDSLANEFSSKIYPVLTNTFGQINSPGIDNDPALTVLILPMVDSAGGYFNPGDGYSKLQYPPSNEREMVYLNALCIEDPKAKSFLAHEFMHLITENQKNILHKVSEETWLNEAYSEYAPTLLGYDSPYEGSNLQSRVNSFLSKPQDSLTEWQNTAYDYGSVSVFIHYLVDQYGAKVLVDALHSSATGIPSINEALHKNGFNQDFSQVFTDWTIAVLVNDCNLGQKYCYKDPNLKNLKIVPLLNFLPLTGEDSSLSITHKTTNWSGNWQKIMGGKGDLSLEFSGASTVSFRVPYLVCDYQNSCTVEFMDLDSSQNGKLEIADFSDKYSSITIIPTIQTKISGFDGTEPFYLFSWTVSSVNETSQNQNQNDELIQKLLAQIDYLKKQIASVQARIAAIVAGQSTSCQKLEQDLYLGMMANSDVSCLQEFLKSQGNDIYPEGLITGNFLSLTKNSVIRFQAKYASEILAPANLQQGTGYVGPLTRQKINSLSNF